MVEALNSHIQNFQFLPKDGRIKQLIWAQYVVLSFPPPPLTTATHASFVFGIQSSGHSIIDVTYLFPLAFSTSWQRYTI